MQTVAKTDFGWIPPVGDGGLCLLRAKQRRMGRTKEGRNISMYHLHRPFKKNIRKPSVRFVIADVAQCPVCTMSGLAETCRAEAIEKTSDHICLSNSVCFDCFVQTAR